MDIKLDHERSLKGKAKILRLLQKEVDHYQETVDELQPQADHYRGLMQEAKEEFYDWKERKDELTKDKRLNKICHKKGDKSSEAIVHKMFDDDVEFDSDYDDRVDDGLVLQNGKQRSKSKMSVAGGSKSKAGKRMTPRGGAASGSSAGSSRSGSGGKDNPRTDSKANLGRSITSATVEDQKTKEMAGVSERPITTRKKRASARPKSSAVRKSAVHFER